jgi:hypothetical protein
MAVANESQKSTPAYFDSALNGYNKKQVNERVTGLVSDLKDATAARSTSRNSARKPTNTPRRPVSPRTSTR